MTPLQGYRKTLQQRKTGVLRCYDDALLGLPNCLAMLGRQPLASDFAGSSNNSGTEWATDIMASKNIKPFPMLTLFPYIYSIKTSL